MANAYLYRRREPVTAGELADLVRHYPGAPAWWLQEETDTLEFELVNAAWLEALPAGMWSRGRVFGPRTEMRWWAADDNGYEVLVLSETQPDLPAAEWQEQRLEIRERYYLYLWGERKEGDDCWIETRIPRPLHHPLNEQEWRQRQLPYVVVEALDYAENGVVRLTRLVRLIPADLVQGGSDG